MNPDKPMLLVEDDDVDAKTVLRALKELHIVNPVERVTNGEEALARLRDPTRARPGLVFLDLNMPVMGGIEFLQVARTDEALRRIPVVVLTTSQLETDKVASFDLCVAGYMVKPADYLQFVEVMRSVNVYWSLSEAP